MTVKIIFSRRGSDHKAVIKIGFELILGELCAIV